MVRGMHPTADETMTIAEYYDGNQTQEVKACLWFAEKDPVVDCQSLAHKRKTNRRLGGCWQEQTFLTGPSRSQEDVVDDGSKS